MPTTKGRPLPYPTQSNTASEKGTCGGGKGSGSVDLKVGVKVGVKEGDRRVIVLGVSFDGVSDSELVSERVASCDAVNVPDDVPEKVCVRVRTRVGGLCEPVGEGLQVPGLAVGVVVPEGVTVGADKDMVGLRELDRVGMPVGELVAVAVYE